jgi:DnaJ domain
MRIGVGKAGAANSAPMAAVVVTKGMAAAGAKIRTPYDVLGLPWNASDGAIRTAFRKAAKARHPDLNAGDPTAEQQFRQVIAAYNMLKTPQQRAAYDQYLGNSRREIVRRSATPIVAGLASGTIVALMVWLSVWLPNRQELPGPPQTPRIAAAKISQPASQQVVADDSGARRGGDVGRESDSGADAPNTRLPHDWPRHLQQSARSLHPTASHPEPEVLLAREWQQVQARGNPRTIWAFTVRNPDAPESELARSRLIALIDAAEDVSLLHVLRLVATDAIAERARERLIRLGVLALPKEDSVASGAPSSNSLLPASVDETIKAGNRNQQSAKQQRSPTQQRVPNQQPAAKHQRPDDRKVSNAQETACAAVLQGRCLGRDPDPSVRFMIQHDASLVND